MLLYRWHDPSPENSCTLCQYHRDRLYAPNNRPPLPAHAGCQCYYTTEETDAPPDPDAWNWATMPDDVRDRWLSLAKWHHDAGRPIRTPRTHITNQAQPPDLLPIHLGALTQLTTGPRPTYQAEFIVAGRIRQRNNKPGHIIIEAAAIEAAVLSNMFVGLPMYINHTPDDQPPDLTRLAAITLSNKYDPTRRAATGTFRLYSNDAARDLQSLIADISADAAHLLPVPDIGLSLVVWPEYAPKPVENARVAVAFQHIDSIDFVHKPAAHGRVLFAGKTQGETQMELDAQTVTIALAASNLPDDIRQRLAAATYANADALTAAIAAARQELAAPPPPPAPIVADPWRDYYQQNAVASRLQTETNLPTLMRQRLAAAHYQNPTELEAAITAAHAEAAQLLESNTVQLPGSTRAIRSSHMITGHDQYANAINYLFGAPKATLPPPDLRLAASLYRDLTGDLNFRGRYDHDHVKLASANTTTLADLAVDAMNKVIIDRWNSQALAPYRWFEMVVAVQPNNSTLHAMKWLIFGGIGDLSVVADGGPYTEKTVADSKESDEFITHGNYVGLTRRTWMNSDIMKMQAIPRELATAAVRTRSKNIASIFTLNSGVGPTLDDDATALFHANHSNYATTTYSINAWKAARLECFKQTELNSSKRLGFYPKFILVPGDLYDQCLIDFGYGAGSGGYPGTTDNDVNPYAQARPNDPRPIPIAVPEFTDTNDWYYLVDPMVAPIIQMSYSANPGGVSHPAPEIFFAPDQDSGLLFTNDTMPIKVRDEYAYGVATYRGIGGRVVA